MKTYLTLFLISLTVSSFYIMNKNRGEYYRLKPGKTYLGSPLINISNINKLPVFLENIRRHSATCMLETGAWLSPNQPLQANIETLKQIKTVIQPYNDIIEAIYLVDEPYLNGWSENKLNNLVEEARKIFRKPIFIVYSTPALKHGKQEADIIGVDPYRIEDIKPLLDWALNQGKPVVLVGYGDGSLIYKLFIWFAALHPTVKYVFWFHKMIK